MDETDRYQKLLTILNCGLSKTKDEHISEDPILLSCGHTICRKCLLPEVDHRRIRCNTCQKLNERDLNSKLDAKTFEYILNDHIADLYNVIYKLFDEKLRIYKNIVVDTEESLNKEINFVKEEIQIRIESLKIELDLLNEEFNETLDEIKQNWQLEFKDLKNSQLDEEILLEAELEKLKTSISTNQNLTEHNLYEYQNSVRKLNKIIADYKNHVPKIEFSASALSIDSTFVGKISNEEFILKEIANSIKNNKFESINIANTENVLNCWMLPNGYSLLTDKNNKTLLLYNNLFQFIKSFNSINHRSFEISDVDYNGTNEIYFSDWRNDRIIKTDLDFNQVAVSSYNDQINGPCGICFYGNSVFVCSLNNQSIVKLDACLNFQSIHNQTYRPWHIKIINDVVCVRSDTENDLSIHFHDVKTFNQIRKYKGHNGTIGIFNSCFIEYYADNATLYCYDKNGMLKKEIQTMFSNGLSRFDGTIHEHPTNHSKLIICSGIGNSLTLL